MTSDNRDMSSHTPDDLLPALRRLGFTDHEARAYLALTQDHPATAYTVAKRAALPRANTYTVLRSLEQKGAIEAVSESPVRYTPRAPEDFFSGIAHQTALLCDEVAVQVAALSVPSPDTFMWYCEGVEAVRKKVDELIDQAAQRVWIKAPRYLIEPHLERLRAACERGVQVLIVAFGTAVEELEVHARMKVLPHEGHSEMFRGPNTEMFTMTTDVSGMVIANHPAGQPSTASYARNRSIVHVVQTLLLHEFLLVEIYAKLGDQLDEAFGPGLHKLRRKYQPPHMRGTSR